MSDDLLGLLGKRISKYRRAAGLTQERLADRLSVAPETVSRMERGVNAPSVVTLGKIAGLLGVGVHDLFSQETVTTEKEVALDCLVTLLRGRQVEEIRLVQQTTELLLGHLDGVSSEGKQTGRGGANWQATPKMNDVY